MSSLPSFYPTPVATVRYVSELIDAKLGNNDGQISAQEADWGKQIFTYFNYNPNLANIFGAIKTGLENGNANVDAEGDGFMSYKDVTDATSDLTRLARTALQPTVLEPSDFVNSLPEPGDFKPVHVEQVRYISSLVDFYVGDRDGKLSESEARSAAQIIGNNNADLGTAFTKIADALRDGNANVDSNDDGKLNFTRTWFGSNDELTPLAARTGQASFLESSDF